MQKEKGIVSIKVKLLGVIVPVVIVSILVLVLIAYRTSAGLIESYSENLLESSVENQASQIESWLEQNIGAFQIVKTTIENTKPDDKELQTMLDWFTVRAPNQYTHLFSPLNIADFPTLFRSLSPGATNARVQLVECVSMLNSFGGYGISTVCASTTPFGLALAPGLPWEDEPSPGNLRFSAIMIPT